MRTSNARGLCTAHYQRLLHKGDVLADIPLRSRASARTCSAPGCERPHQAKGLCASHYYRVRKGGSAERPLGERPDRSYVDQNGYRVIYRPDHPNAWTNGVIPEHRYVMSQTIGRPLVAGETVHHVNGDRLDNRPDNLELWAAKHGPGQRTEDKVADALAVLKRYAPEALAV